ncbi:MAG: hypothetical protein R2793_04055, partial [Flavobacteriaceae bacterium]
MTIYWEKPVKTSKANANATYREQLFAFLGLQIDRDRMVFQQKWIDKAFANKSSVTITNTIWGDVTQEELKRIDKSKVPSSLSFSLESSQSRGLFYTGISISP